MKITFCIDDGEILETLKLTDGDRLGSYADLRNAALTDAYRSAESIISARNEKSRR